jgi:hypothetical protein
MPPLLQPSKQIVPKMVNLLWEIAKILGIWLRKENPLLLATLREMERRGLLGELG